MQSSLLPCVLLALSELCIARSWPQNERKEHSDKWTGRGCPVTLPLLQQSSIIFFQVSEEQGHSKSKKISLMRSAGLSSDRGLMMRMKRSQWYMFIFEIEEKLVLVLFMHPALVGVFVAFEFFRLGRGGVVVFVCLFVCVFSLFSMTWHRESSWHKTPTFL